MCDQQRLRSVCAYAQSDQSLCQFLEYFMDVKVVTEFYSEFPRLKIGGTGLSESTLVKMDHSWNSYVTALFICGCGQCVSGTQSLIL